MRAWEKDLARRLSSATTWHDACDVYSLALREHMGVSGVNVVPLSAPWLAIDDLYMNSDEIDPSFVKQRFLAGVEFIEQEILPFDQVLMAGGVVIDCSSDDFLREADKTAAMNEFWKPCRIDRPAVRPLAMGARPFGYVGLARTRKQGAYSADELRGINTASAAFEACLATSAVLPWPGLAVADGVSTVLAAAIPIVCALFDQAGRLRWMSDEAQVRLEIEAARVGSTRIVSASSPLFDCLRRAALEALNDPGEAFNTSAPYRCLPTGEIVVVRLVQDQGTKLAMAALAGAPVLEAAHAKAVPTQTGIPGLTPREADVAFLAASGYACLNIAADLGISEHTVRTHLKRIYRKLGVSSRVSLALAIGALMTPPDPSSIGP
jgi:DNA-binding CsgD family transcriptional regulator